METSTERYNRWKNHPNLDAGTYAELTALTDRAEINDRFYQDLKFGTGGIRGVMGAGTNRLNSYIVRRVAAGLADYLHSAGKSGGSGVVIAYDTRHHSRDFADEMAQTLAGCGVAAMLYEMPVPTPVLSFSVPHLHASAGVMITASHNPPAYNGMKLYDENGVQFTPQKANALTACINRQPDALELKRAAAAAEIKKLGEQELDAYINAVFTQALPVSGKDNLSIVYTPIHGTGLDAVTRILSRDGFTSVSLVAEQTSPDGAFPTVVSPNPEERGALEMGIALAERTNADLILGTDPDADRLGVGVRHGGTCRLLTGNQIGALLVWFVLEKRKSQLTGADTIIKTIVTGELGAEIAKSYGVQVVDTLTGFKYIGEAAVGFETARDRVFLMGYEESYGYLVGTHARDKDAIVSAMLITELAADAKSRGQSLIDVLNGLYACYGFYLDALETVLLPGESGMKQMKAIMQRFRGSGTDAIPETSEVCDYLAGAEGLPKENVLRFMLTDGSWMAVRPSGTEPKLKFYFSIRGEDHAAAEKRLNAIRSSVLRWMETSMGEKE